MQKEKKTKKPIVFIFTHCYNKSKADQILIEFYQRYNQCLKIIKQKGKLFPKFENVLFAELFDLHIKYNVFGITDILSSF